MSNLLQRAADATACQMLNDIGRAGTEMAVWTMWSPKVSAVALTTGALSYMANNLLCQEMDGPPTSNGQSGGCKKKLPGYGGKILFKPCDADDVMAYCSLGGPTDVNEILKISETETNGGVSVWYEISYRRVNGEIGTVEGGSKPGLRFYISGDPTQCDQFNDPDPPQDPVFDPYTYTDPETNCNYTLKLEGFVQQYEYGPAQPVYQIQSSGGGVGTRNDGGRMGGCNLSPTIFVHNGGGNGGGGGGGPQYPVPPTLPPDGPDGVPWWLPPLLGATTGALLNQIGRLLNDTFNYEMNPGVFDFVAPCDYTDQGANQVRQWSFGKEPLIARLHSHQVAMMEMLQQHLDWKTPTCGDVSRTPLEGQWVTTRWESIEKMEHSGRRLRKLFRYRTKSTRDLGQLSAYWSGFIWRAGPVCVRHTEAWWGDPQVWAESAEEGKRVIRHAAAEAGIDPDQVGRWAVSSSRSPRYGMSGTMKVKVYEGFPWVASREGPSWPNTLALYRDP